MAMVISPRSKIVTLSLLIGIITLVALIITGVIGFWSGNSEKTNGTGTKMVSSQLQQITGYAAMQHAKVLRGYKRTRIEDFSKIDGKHVCDRTVTGYFREVHLCGDKSPIFSSIYYFLAIYLKGLLQSLKLYAGHPSDLVKCTADFDVRYPRQFSRTGFSIAHLCRPVGSVDTPCGQQCAANGSR
ncbi:hypothetical protein ALC62_04071 [Cyphomyrmex costatus]|uniref:Uncharacterized protein n=1 Tax=Cyphomyrmex costatus TaxID=456900 RepID=A0A195CWM8_9HYME|nr:hypothetical protein ALC62_04071 [Cyphomyrmex costatus]